LHHAVAGALALHGVAVELAREADGEVGHVDHLLHLALALGEDLAHLQGDQGAQVVLVPAELLAHLAHDEAAQGRGRHAPAQERLVGALHHALVVRLAGLLDLRQEPAVGGAEDVKKVAGAEPRLAVGGSGVHVRDLEAPQERGHVVLALHGWPMPGPLLQGSGEPPRGAESRPTSWRKRGWSRRWPKAGSSAASSTSVLSRENASPKRSMA